MPAVVLYLKALQCIYLRHSEPVHHDTTTPLWLDTLEQGIWIYTPHTESLIQTGV